MRISTLFLLLVVFLSSCEQKLNDQNILGSWKVQEATFIPLLPSYTPASVAKAEKRLESTRYTFLADGYVTVTRGDGEVHKGGTWMLDMERKILTIQENYREMMLPSILWTIEESTPHTMTLFSTESGKSNSRLKVKKVGA